MRCSDRPLDELYDQSHLLKHSPGYPQLQTPPHRNEITNWFFGGLWLSATFIRPRMSLYAPGIGMKSLNARGD